MRSRGRAVLVVALVVDAAGNGLFAPLSLIYFTRLTDVSLALVGTLLTVANLVALPVPIWAGAWADRIGPRPLVICSEALMTAGFLAYAAVSGPIGILVSATLVAIGVRVFWCTVFTLLADYADGDRGPRARTTDGWYAIANVARMAGIAVGGLVTGVVAADGTTAAYRGVALTAAAALGVAALLVAVGVRAPRHVPGTATEPVGYRELLRDRPYLGLIGVNTVFAGTSMMFALALPTVVLTTGAPVWLTAVLLTANAVLIVALSAPLVRSVSGMRRTTALVGAAGLWAVWCACSRSSGSPARSWRPSCWSRQRCCSPSRRRCTPRSPPPWPLPLLPRRRVAATCRRSSTRSRSPRWPPGVLRRTVRAGRGVALRALGLLNLLGVLVVRRLDRTLPGGGRRRRGAPSRLTAGRPGCGPRGRET